MRLLYSALVPLVVFGGAVGCSWWKDQERQTAARLPATAQQATQAPAREGPYQVTLRPAERRADIVEALDLLQEEPCHRAAALRVVRGLAEEEGFRNAVIVGTAFRERCGSDDMITRVLLTSYVQLSDYDNALRMASEYIDANRADPSARTWRGQVYAKQGNLEAAVADFRDSLALFPDPGKVHPNLYWQLANALDKAGRPCDGVVVLRSFLSFDPVERRSAQISSLIAELSQRGNCAAAVGAGAADIRFRSKSGAIEVSATVNGKAGRFLVDTGASAVSVTRAYAEKAGLPLTETRDVMLHTANGVTTAKPSRAATVALGGAVAKNVFVVVLPEGKGLGPGLDGLLGLSFLANFDIRISGDRLSLTPPDTAAASRR